jgi:PrcB C-terminal
MPPSQVIAAAILIALASGCATQASRAQELAMNRLDVGATPFALTSGLVESGEFVVRDPATWEDVWNRINMRRRPIPPTPNVDFTERMILVVALGQQRSGGYRVTVESTRLEDRTIVVTSKREEPGAGCIVTSSLTQPLDIVIVPRHDEPVVFHSELVQTPCR